MARMFLFGLFLVLASLAPLGQTRDTEWKDYTPYWCTPLGRILMSRGTTFEECKSYCDEGCGAIEWWEGGSQACYLCTDLSLLIKFPYAQDLSYPPHVFIKQSGVKPTPTTIPNLTGTKPIATTSDEGIPTMSPEEVATTPSIDEIFTSIITTDEDDISSTPDQEGTPSSTTDQEDITSDPFRVTTLVTDLNEDGTFEPEREGTTSTLGQEVTKSTPVKRRTTSVSYVEGTTAAPQHKMTTSALDLQETTPDSYQEGPTSPTDEERTTTEADQERTTLSPGTTSALDQQGTTSPPEVTTPTLDQEGTTSSPGEETTTSSPEEEETTSAPDEEATASTAAQEDTTSSPDQEATTSAPEQEATASTVVQKQTTSSPDQEATTSIAAQKETTSSPDQEATTSTAAQKETTSSPDQEATTSAPEQEATASTAVQEQTTSSPDQEATTSAPNEEETTSAPDQETTTLTPVEDGTTSAPNLKATTSIPDRERTTFAPDQEGTTSALDQEGTTPAPKEDTTTSAPDQEATTPGPDQEETTTSAPDQEGTTTPTDLEGTTSLPDREKSTSSTDHVATTSEPSQKVTTVSSQQEVSTSSRKGTTPVPYQGEITSVPGHGKKTTGSDEEGTTASVEDGTSSVPTESYSTMTPATVPGAPLSVSTKAISETELEVSWEPPIEGNANILLYRVQVIDLIGGGLTRFIQVPGDVQSVMVDSLSADTEYLFMVTAGNQHGIGPLSEKVYGQTKAIRARIEPTEGSEVQKPVVRLSHRTDFVVAGMDKSTRAICFVSGQYFIGWFKSSGEQVIGTGPNDRMFVEHEDDGYSLVIRRLMQSDGGEYVCRGSKTKATYSLYVEFFVEDPPPSQNLWLNQEGEIFVGVKIGYPAPEYLWKKDGVKFDANSGRFNLQPDGTIKISRVAAEDAGEYRVRISQLNRRRETSETIKVKVFDPPMIDNTKPPERNLTFGYPATLECLVSGIPKPEITWTGPDGKTITESGERVSLSSDGSLKIPQVNLSDMGKWTCDAMNSVGKASRQIEVQAIYMPPEIHQISNITANEGENEVLKCTASGFPLPNVVWVRDNEEYPGQMKKPGESVINLENLGLDDISQFVCEASNAATDEEGEIIVRKATVNVFVMVEPRPYDSYLVKEPVFSELGSPVPVRLACAFTGYPPPEVWIEKNRRVVATSIESVWIDILTDGLDDYGLYYCRAENVVNPSKLNYTFEIRRSEAPKFTLEPKLPSRNPTAGLPVTMTWDVSGIPKPEVRWKSPSEGYVGSDNPRFLLSEGKLTIKSLEEKDAGMWTIEATNSIKTTKAQVEFSMIYVRPQIAPIPDVVVNEGESATLTCTASGVPTPDVKWIKEGEEYNHQKKTPGKSEVTLQNLGLEDNSQFTCEAKNGAQDGEGNALVSEQGMKLIVKVEPRPVSSPLRAKPVLSYVGNPKPVVFNCEFSGYPPPDVTIIKDGEVLASSEDTLSYSVTIDSVGDFGEYVCMAENEVGKSTKNYTFEITSSDEPSIPRDFTGEPTCDSVILSWNHPKESGGFPVINYVISYGINTLVISSTLTDFIIDNLNHSTVYSIAIQARTEAGIGEEATVEVKTSQFCKISSCVNIIENEQLYTLNASQGHWPRDGFCRAMSAYSASEPDMYRLSADFYVPGTKGSMVVTYVGVFFNAENENNFDFIFFRIGASDNPCFQTGEIQQGRLNWYGSQVGSCPHGPPRNARWIHITLEVRKSDVSVFLEGVHVTSFQGHFPPKGAGGVLLANRHGSVIQFKDFIITDIPSLAFETKSCATVQDNMKYYSMISQGDFWAQGFCRALLKEVDMEETSSYQVSVDLFSELGWSGDRIAYLGIMFNARDINNADFIYFRPYWKEHCYQTGYIMGGRQRREGAKTGPCSCTVTGGKWFNVRLEIRGSIVSVFMNGLPAVTFKSHYPTTNKGSGVLVTGGCRKSIRFRNFNVTSLPLLPFTSKNCQSARDAGGYYKLMAYPGIEDTTQPGVCRAVYPKSIQGNSYVISVSFYAQGSLLGGKYGVMFNVKNADSFEFVYFRPYNHDDCVQIGYLQGTKINEGEGRQPKSLTCAYGFMRGGSWYDVRVKVRGSEVKVIIDDVEVAVFKSRFPTIGRGGIMVASGFKRKISFKDFRIL